ncbi:hypothetical protein [Acinetobacter ursingii]|uniref:hypothetical protein n=1 Tax=Acinetobacter ursingii TaxID=108980 RepID=UPI00124FC22E|nr:hypothetical protein [Acinetobacter ursingii]
MSYDLDLVVSYGQKIGAEKALILNDRLSRYYRKGDASSKYCLLFYAKVNDYAPLRWSNSFNYSIKPVITFYEGMGKKVEIIDIPVADHHNETEAENPA